MLQAHSLLWHYLWVAPNLLLLLLALELRRRDIRKQFPIFLFFAVAIGIEQLTLYVADVLPSVGPMTWWYFFWAGLFIEALIKSVLIGEIFGAVFGLYPSVAKLGRTLISGVGVAFVFIAAAVAGYTTKDNTNWIVSGAHLLEQSIYMIECGLIVFLLAFAGYFRLRWERWAFGIILGLGVSASVHFATWALMANGNFAPHYRVKLDFLNMATYHLSVLIWCYYLLVPAKNVSLAKDPPPPEHSLEIWNQELERLIHQ